MDDTADWFESYVYGIDRLDVGHAHGTAEDVPGFLEAIAGTDEQAALTAVGEVALRPAAKPKTLLRADLVGLVAGFCRSGAFDRLDVDLLAEARRGVTDPETRGSAAVACLNLARRIGRAGDAGRDRARSLVVAAAGVLADPDPVPRRKAAVRLSRIGRWTSWVADELAAATRDSDPALAAWATAALAGCGDERAVEPLIRLLGEAECPWRDGDGDAFGILRRMRPYAGRLHAALDAHLRGDVDGSWVTVHNGMIGALGAWGTDAAELATAIRACSKRGACRRGPDARGGRRRRSPEAVA